MDELRFQFTIKRVLIATFWMAACFAATTRLYVGGRDHLLSRAYGWLLMLGAVVSACLAVGVLMQRTREAVIIGGLVVLLVWAIASDVFWS